MSGRARMNLVASLVLALLFGGFLATSYFMPEYANAWPTKYGSCLGSGCHVLVDPNATIATAINGTVGTSVTVAAGGSFEVDWKVNNVTGAPTQVACGLLIAVPTGWTIGKGTANSPAITGWNSVWDVTDGVAAGWATANKFSTATELPASPDGYTINFDTSVWDSGTRNAAYDNASAGDRDGVADNMGTDATVTVPAGTPAGTYSVVVAGVGHDGSTKAHVKQTITVTVSGGTDTTKPVVSAGFAATTPSLNRTITVSGFAATDNVGVTGYMITTSSTAPLSGDAGWLASAPTSYTVASDGSFTLYPWAKDAAGNVSNVYGTPVTVTVDTVRPTVSSTVPVNGATAVAPNSAVTLNFSEAMDCTSITTSTVTISPAVTWTRTSCSGTQAVFTPAGQASTTAYTVTVGTLVDDVAGNTLAAAYPFSYTTSTPVTLPDTAISAPAASAVLTTSPYSITGSATVGSNPLGSVQVSTNNGASWSAATGTTAWSFAWTLPTEDYVAHTILAKAVDNAAYEDATPASVTVRVDNVPPAGLANSAPANLGTNQATTVSLSSTTATDGNTSAAVQYFFEIAKDSGFTTGVQQSGWQTGASFAPTLSVATTYYWHVMAKDAAGNTTAYTTTWSFTTLGPTAPNAPSASQYKLDGTTAIAQGGTTTESSVIVKSTVSDANNDNVTLEVEFITNGNSFAGVANCSSVAVPSGSVASATCAGLTDGVSYKWRARTNDGALQSSWIDFGASDPDVTVALANTAPPVPTALAQYQADGATAIASGGAASTNVVVIAATVDGGNGDPVLLEVDLNNDGIADCASAYVTGPATAKATCGGLADGSYDFRVRAKDQKSAVSAWTAFTGTPDFTVATGLDFGIDTTPPTDGSASASSGDGYLNISWTSATDSGAGLDPVNSYKLVKATGATAPADCSGTAIYTGNGTAYFDSAVVNGTTYSYRVCALDEVGNLSAGVTVSGAASAIALPETAIGAPASAAVLTTSPYSITGTATAGGNALASVQVSTNNGTSWSAATGTTAWSFAWTLSSEDYVAHTILAKAVDSLGYADATPASVTVRVDNVAPAGLAASSPANLATGVATTASLTSTTATDGNTSAAVQYFFEIATDSGFTTAVQQSLWQTGTGFAPTLSPGTTYYWHVKAKDAAGNTTAYTTTWSFTTGVMLPDTAISAPAAGTVLSASPAALTGTATAGTNPLGSVQVSTNNGTSWSAATGTTSWSFSWTLPAEDYVSHTVLAKALDNASNADATPASLTLIVDTVAPAGVANSTPANLATGVLTTSSLVSATATDANTSAPIQYFFELATNSGFTTGVQQSAWQTGTSFAPTLALSTTYYWHVMAKDAAGNTSAYSTTTSFTTSGPTTTVGEGAGETNVTIAPGGVQTDLDAFTLQTQSGTDTVTNVTVTLAAGTYAGIGSIAITDGGATTYGSVANPASNVVSIPLTTSITATTTATQYMVEVVPKSAAAMPAVPGASYAVTALVTAITSGNAKVYGDLASATVTIDNLSPGNVTGVSGIPASGSNTLSWTNPTDSDFDSVVVLSRVGSAVTDTPVEGSSYVVDNVIGSSTVAYVGSGANFTDKSLVNGTAYYYKIFARDANGNFSSGGTAVGPLTPSKSWVNSKMLHNSINTGSTKWAANGGWGAPGTKYGAFTCATCHNMTTTNIKRIKSSVATPDGSPWASNNAATVSVTVANADADYGSETAHTTSARICEVCHSQTSYHKYNQVATTHNGTVNCTTQCHLHTNGFVGEGGDCTGCHSSTQNKGYSGYTRRIITGASGDFVKLSRHVSNGTTTEIVTKYDCSICHMEGDGTSAATTAYHHGTSDTTGLINLRNVDSPATGWAMNNRSMTEQNRTDMDTFCLNCHDADGSKGIAVNATNDGLLYSTTATVARNLSPFNTNDGISKSAAGTPTISNGRDGFTTRNRVIDVKTQFTPGTGTGASYNGNMSQHAVLGQRYWSNDANWTAAAWTSHTLRNGTVINSIREKARLHCSDCHLNETNAHGAANAFYMLLNGVPGDFTSDTAMDSVAYTSSAITCYKCHNPTVYNGTATNAASVVDHKLDGHSNGATYNGTTPTNSPKLGAPCLNCHGGDGFGNIHGTNGTYSPAGSGGTWNRYRFLPGGYMSFAPGANKSDTDFTTAGTGSCYTTTSTWSGCSSHSSTTKAAGSITTTYGRALKY